MWVHSGMARHDELTAITGSPERAAILQSTGVRDGPEAQMIAVCIHYSPGGIEPIKKPLHFCKGLNVVPTAPRKASPLVGKLFRL